MRMISCFSCGVVIDADRFEWTADHLSEEDEETLYPHGVPMLYHQSKGEWVWFHWCPVCKEQIVEDGSVWV